MDIAYSREAMHALLALPARARERAIAAASALAAPGSGTENPRKRLGELMALADGSEFRLAPYSPTGDLVVTRRDDTLVVIALTDVIGSLQKAAEQ